MSLNIVIGLQWGDEGKGKIIDVLASEADVVVRFSGGMNASHTVMDGETSVRFSLVPSAALHRHVKLVIADGVIVNPQGLADEITQLTDAFRFDRKRLMVSENAAVTLPYHVHLDSPMLASDGLETIGTTGVGHGPTRVDQTARQGVRLWEYLSEEFMASSIYSRAAKLITFSPVVSRLWGMVVSDQVQYHKIREMLSPLAGNTMAFLNGEFQRGSRILFEGSQGAMLDLLFGFYPHVTSCSTLAGAASVYAGIPPAAINHVTGVMKAYSTRVDKGEFPTEIPGEKAAELRSRGNEFVHPGGKEMRVGWLDLVSLRYACKINGVTSIALTKVDVLSGVDPLKLCIAYEGSGITIRDQPLEYQKGGLRPKYIEIPGWSAPIGEQTSFASLPSAAKEFVHLIERELAVPVSMVSIGPRRSQTLLKE